MSYTEFFKNHISLIDGYLKEILPAEGQDPSFLFKEMNYAVFSGGKRFRPVMTMAACEACGGRAESALIPAAAIELIHCYSLVHDDLPALDNDDERRGQPTVHKAYGEDIAILTGDGLLTLAFQILSRFKPETAAVRLIEEISTAAGTYGMIGGQVADLRTLSSDLDLATLDFINVHKTGKLIRVSAVAGALAAGAGPETSEHIYKYGELVGLAFQAVDDLLDGDGYLKVLKSSEVRDHVRDLLAAAKRELRAIDNNTDGLMKLADMLLERMPQEKTNNV